MGRKRSRRSRRASTGGGASPPASTPPEPGPPAGAKPEPTAPRRRSRGLLLGLAFLVGASLLIAVVAVLFQEPGGEPAGSPTSPEVLAPLPRSTDPLAALPVPAGALSPPAELSPAARARADEALRLYAEALEAHHRGDVPVFVARARGALAAFEAAGWIPESLSPFHHLFLAEHFRAGDLRTTIVEGRRWLERFPGSPDHLETVGKAEYQAGQFAEAADHLEAFARIHPRSLRTRRQLASVYESLGDKEKGLAAVQESLRLIGHPHPAHARHPEALPTLQTAMRVTHRFYDYPRLLGLARDVLALRPDLPDAHMALGVAARHVGDLEQAERSLSHYLELVERSGRSADQNLNPTRLELALARLKSQEYRAALEVLVDILVDDPHFTRAHFQLGQVLTRLGRAPLGEAFFQRARDLAPADRERRREIELRALGQRARAERARAMALRLQGDYTEAAQILETALRQSGGSPEVLVYLVETLLATGRVEEASRRLAEGGERLGPRHPDRVGWTARIHRERGDFEGARQRFASLCQSSTRNLQTWGLDLARLLLRDLDRPAEALPVLDRLLELGPDPAARLLRGAAHLAAGDPARALEDFSAVPPGDRHRGEGPFHAEHALALLNSPPPTSTERVRLLLESVPVHLRGHSSSLRALARYLSSGGEDDGLEPWHPGLIGGKLPEPDALEARALAHAGREKQARELEQAAARDSGAAAASKYREASRIREELGDGVGALDRARRARAVGGNSRETLDLLLRLLDHPADLFLRHQLERERARLAGAAAPDRRSLVESLLGPS